MPTYRIMRRGASHRSRRRGESEFRVHGYGDPITLTDEQYRSGRYDHLGLVAVGSDPSPVPNEPVKDPVPDPVVDNSTQTNDSPNVFSEDDRARISSLLADVQAVDSKQKLDVARKSVIESGVLGSEDQVPTKKVEILSALEALLGESGE